jgi:hypothetical protein
MNFLKSSILIYNILVIFKFLFIELIENKIVEINITAM